MNKNHLKETGLTYIEHMRRAWSFSLDLFTTSLLMLVHGLFPNLFQKHGTGRLEVWFNTMKTPLPNSDKWFVFVNEYDGLWVIEDGDKEFITKKIKINVPCQTDCDSKSIVCYGKLSGDDDLMVIE